MQDDAAVASCASIGGATAQLGMGARNNSATAAGTGRPVPSMTGRQLRAQLRAQQARNQHATVRHEPDEASCAATVLERARAKALAMLDGDTRRIAVVAEPGDPARVVIAIRGVAIGELMIPAERYDGFALLALMRQYGQAAVT